MTLRFKDRLRILTASAGPLPAKRRVAGIILGSLLAFAGVSHLSFARREFRSLVPDWVPADRDAVVVASGVAEIGLGAALIALPRHRVPVGLAVAAFFVAVFPGNIAQFLERREAFGLDSDAARLSRLFFQPLLVMWAAWSTGVVGALRRTRQR
ncbi:hypothetical protein [Paeniglutamicibacter sp.]|uniref:DoxX family protein n=1 Tax=Paeniglutamicibacter sp. TaxID=1934391 RepID=UPI00398931B9